MDIYIEIYSKNILKSLILKLLNYLEIILLKLVFIPEVRYISISRKAIILESKLYNLFLKTKIVFYNNLVTLDSKERKELEINLARKKYYYIKNRKDIGF